MKYIQILRNKGYSIRAEEEALRSRLETLEKEFTRSSVFKGKFLEIYTQVRSLSDAVQYSEKQDSYSLVDESSLDAIGEVSSKILILDIKKSDSWTFSLDKYITIRQKGFRYNDTRLQ